MWIKSKFGDPVNLDVIGWLQVLPNPDNPTTYEVQGFNSVSTLYVQFLVGTSMTLAEATALHARLCEMIGTVDLND